MTTPNEKSVLKGKGEQLCTAQSFIYIGYKTVLTYWDKINTKAICERSRVSIKLNYSFQSLLFCDIGENNTFPIDWVVFLAA